MDRESSIEDTLRERWAVLLDRLADAPTKVQDKDPAEVARRNARFARSSTLRELSSDQMQIDARNRLKLAQLAFANDRLKRLFPYTSVSSLCFSRCSTWPYTDDLPCIASAQGSERYVVGDRPFANESATVLGDTADASEAVRIAADALPPNATDIWVGNTEDRPTP